MEHIEVKSSNIKSVGYDPASETLEVCFLSKKEGEAPRVYRYDAVPYEKYRQFLNAPSVGSHFAAHIRNNYQSHRIDTPKEKKDADRVLPEEESGGKTVE